MKISNTLLCIIFLLFSSCDKKEKTVLYKVSFLPENIVSEVEKIKITYINHSDFPVFFHKKGLDFNNPPKCGFNNFENCPEIILDTIISGQINQFEINRQYRKWARQLIKDDHEKVFNFYFGTMRDSLEIYKITKESDLLFLNKNDSLELTYKVVNMNGVQQKHIFIMKDRAIAKFDSLILKNNYNTFHYLYPKFVSINE